MGQCNLDHSQEDVRQKFDQQRPYLPAELVQQFQHFFMQEQTQEILNEVFHLLKKYDLVSPEEKKERENRLYSVLNNS